MRNIMASAAEAKYGTIFINTQTYVHIRTTLYEMGRKEGPKEIQVDNSTAVGITTKEFRENNSKAMDMSLYQIDDMIEQGQIQVF